VDAVTNAVDNLSNQIKNFTINIGPTGSGKSTLANYMHGAQLTHKKVTGGKF